MGHRRAVHYDCRTRPVEGGGAARRSGSAWPRCWPADRGRHAVFPDCRLSCLSDRSLEAWPMSAKRFTAAHQSITFSRRMMLVGGAQAAIGAVLVARLGYLAVAQNEHYKLLSESNRVQLIPVPPRR